MLSEAAAAVVVVVTAAVVNTLASFAKEGTCQPHAADIRCSRVGRLPWLVAYRLFFLFYSALLQCYCMHLS